MPALSLTLAGANGLAHNWTHVSVPLTEIRTLLNTTKLDYLNVQDNGLRPGSMRSHASPLGLRHKVRNDSGSAMAANDLIYFSGTYSDGTDNYPTVALADASATLALHLFAVGVADAAISNDADGTVAQVKEISGVDTSSGAVGDPVYLSTTAGSWTLTRPSSSEFVQVVGYVEVVHASTGRILLDLTMPQEEWFSGEAGGVGVMLDEDKDSGLYAAAEDDLRIRIAGSDSLTFVAATATFVPAIVVDDTTDSASGTTGSIQTDGGLGVAKNVYVSEQIHLLDSKAMVFGTGEDATISYDGTNLLINPDVVGSGAVVIDGNVGIGTASPGEVLDVTTATDATGIIIKNTSQSPTFTLETGHANGGARNWDFITNKTNFGDWQLRVGASQGAAPGTVVMAADNAGNVGIGTASPTEALQIAGSGHKVQLVDSGDSYNLRVNLEDVPGYGGYFSLHDDSEVANVTLRSYGDSHFNGGNVFIGDTTNTNMTQGLTINQGANDDEALALKSSDVGHAMTGYAEADTYGTLKKGEATAGGLLVMGFKDADGAASAALRLQGNLGEAADTTDITASDGVVQISGNITDGGTSIAAVAATGNLVSFDNADTTRLLIKGDGALHATNITAGSGDLDGVALDGEDDIGLIRTFERTLHNNVGIMMTRWDAQIDANAEDLKRVGVLSSEGHFYNMQRMNSLLGGGIWQNHTHIMELKEALDDRDHRIALLEAQVKGLIQ